MPASSKGFTLVELLVVMAILAMIASIAGPQVMKQFAGAKADAAQLQIQDLGASFDLFFLDIGRYPSVNEGINALLEQPAGLNQWNGPYLRSGGVPADPWGNAYLYSTAGGSNTYHLSSLGADNSPGGENDNADIEINH